MELNKKLKKVLPPTKAMQNPKLKHTVIIPRRKKEYNEQKN